MNVNVSLVFFDSIYRDVYIARLLRSSRLRTAAFVDEFEKKKKLLFPSSEHQTTAYEYASSFLPAFNNRRLRQESETE